MSQPSLLLETNPFSSHCPQGLDKSVLDYDNIYPNMYKIGASFDPEKAKMVDVSELHNLWLWFWSLCDSRSLMLPMDVPMLLAGLGLPGRFLSNGFLWLPRSSPLVKELTIKDGKLYQYPVGSDQRLTRREWEFANKAQTKNCYELNCSLKRIAKTKSSSCRCRRKGLSSHSISLKDWSQSIVARLGSNMPKNSVRAISCTSLTKRQPLIFSLTILIFEIFINKGEKYFLVGSTHYADQNGILIKSGTPTGTYYELDYGRKANWCRQLAGVSPTTVSRVINKKDTCLKNDPKVQEAMRELAINPNNVAS